MRMINKDTGVVADLPGAVGGAWVPLESKTEDDAADKKPSEEKKEPDEESHNDECDLEAVTKKEIMQELEALGVKYDKKATKKELYDLMMRG